VVRGWGKITVAWVGENFLGLWVGKTFWVQGRGKLSGSRCGVNFPGPGGGKLSGSRCVVNFLGPGVG
jgi:hypothetical protein